MLIFDFGTSGFAQTKSLRNPRRPLRTDGLFLNGKSYDSDDSGQVLIGLQTLPGIRVEISHL
jgi:hypothetical protein